MFFQRKPRPIPKQWITNVSEKLRRGCSNEIEWTNQAFGRWHFYGTRKEAYEAMLKALAAPGIIGKHIKMPIDE
jgi:hypothetical protein